ncbi:hypothetical protein CKA32_001367 [Geitlerinema sp. FC II]|nr:hypothetical protein CKA32_001367 [Geitlerinema sp. FC II]
MFLCHTNVVIEILRVLNLRDRLNYTSASQKCKFIRSESLH